MIFWIQMLIQIFLPVLDTFFHLEDLPLLSRMVLPKKMIQSHHAFTGTGADETREEVLSLCCPGAGFAGFWFTLGRLFAMEKRESLDVHSSWGILEQHYEGDDKRLSLLENISWVDGTYYEDEPVLAVDNLNNHNNNSIISSSDSDLVDNNQPIHYHCFSAGCLGVVSILQNYTLSHVFDMALTSRERWKKGEITRYQVVEDFVNQLLEIPTLNDTERNVKKERLVMSGSALSRIHVITTRLNFSSWNLFQQVTTSPRTIHELKELLLQTTFIPFATGDGFWFQSSSTASQGKYIDGAFSAFQHEKCHVHLALPFDAKLLLNALNINLHREDAELLWHKGLEFD